MIIWINRFTELNHFGQEKTLVEVEGFFRAKRCIHEFSKLLLQLVFRWGDAGTYQGIGWMAINIEKIKEGGW